MVVLNEMTRHRVVLDNPLFEPACLVSDSHVGLQMTTLAMMPPARSKWVIILNPASARILTPASTLGEVFWSVVERLQEGYSGFREVYGSA